MSLFKGKTLMITDGTGSFAWTRCVYLISIDIVFVSASDNYIYGKML